MIQQEVKFCVDAFFLVIDLQFRFILLSIENDAKNRRESQPYHSFADLQFENRICY